MWQEKIHSVIKILQKYYGLKWILVRIYYHRLSNIGEILQGDILGKPRKGIVSKDFLNREYNCSSTTKLKVTCAYKGECGVCRLVYKVEYRLCISVYVGNTKNTPKKRMQQHFQDVAQKLQHDENLYTFVAHFAQYFDQKLTTQQCREIMKFEILGLYVLTIHIGASYIEQLITIRHYYISLTNPRTTENMDLR